MVNKMKRYWGNSSFGILVKDVATGEFLCSDHDFTADGTIVVVLLKVLGRHGGVPVVHVFGQLPVITVRHNFNSKIIEHNSHVHE